MDNQPFGAVAPPREDPWRWWMGTYTLCRDGLSLLLALRLLVSHPAQTAADLVISPLHSDSAGYLKKSPTREVLQVSKTANWDFMAYRVVKGTE